MESHQMTPKQFWSLFVLRVVAFLTAVVLVLAFLGILVKPRICEAVQTHENRTVTRCF